MICRSILVKNTLILEHQIFKKTKLCGSKNGFVNSIYIYIDLKYEKEEIENGIIFENNKK